MVQTLEAIKGGGGSIKVGATGTISALISRELNSKKVSPSDEASSSESHKKSPETARKKKHYNRKTHQIPILESDNVSVDGTPVRQRKGPKMVEIVDINCGVAEKTWARPLKNRLKKLSFSKLAENKVQESNS